MLFLQRFKPTSQIQDLAMGRFMKSPTMQKIAQSIVSEREAERRAIQDQIDKLSGERRAAMAETAPAVDEAKAAYKRIWDVLEPAAKIAIQRASHAHSKAAQLHRAELEQLRKQLADLPVIESDEQVAA